MTTMHNTGRSTSRKYMGQKAVKISFAALVPTYEGDTKGDGNASAHQSVVDALTNAKLIDKHAPDSAPLVVDPKSIKVE